MSDTVLELSGIGIADYSARAASQTLEPIGSASANIKRDVNGGLHNLGSGSFQKYKSTIQCQDMRPFIIDGVWPGKLVTVKCVAELSYVTAGGSPSRAVVSGSSRTEGSLTYYRPALDMMVVAFSIQVDEWSGDVSWRMDLEEV